MVRLLQPSNAMPPMFVTLSGIVTLVRLVFECRIANNGNAVFRYNIVKIFTLCQRRKPVPEQAKRELRQY